MGSQTQLVVVLRTSHSLVLQACQLCVYEKEPVFIHVDTQENNHYVKWLHAWLIDEYDVSDIP